MSMTTASPAPAKPVQPTPSPCPSWCTTFAHPGWDTRDDNGVQYAGHRGQSFTYIDVGGEERSDRPGRFELNAFVEHLLGTDSSGRDVLVPGHAHGGGAARAGAVRRAGRGLDGGEPMTATTETCPSWCVGCHGDHSAHAGDETWPIHNPSQYNPGDLQFCAYPTWELGAALADVSLWVTSEDGEGIDLATAFTPDEAIAFAEQMIRAARAAKEASA